MTQLSCMYCGRKLRINGTQTYGKGRCPSCKHIIFIPKEGPADNKKDWSGLKDEQIIDKLESEPYNKAARDYPKTEWSFDPERFRTLLPSYDEISLFTLSFSFIALFSMSSQLRDDLYNALVTVKDGRVIVISLLSVIGMFLSFVNVFFRREKYDTEKYLMLLFAVVVTAGTGIYSGYIIWDESKGWLLIFPIWNIANGAILLLLLRAGILDTDCIIENDASLMQVLVSIAAVGIILWLCNHVFKMHWVISYSICVCYTITINDALHSLAGINKINPAATQETN
jgi:phage FluMu protein Com